MISIQVGDITRLEVDAIVNAANTTLLGGGGVDGAIHRTAGPGLRKECEGGCPTGEARITSAHALPAKHIIHAVGPVWSGGKGGEAELLESCYRHCLELARERGVRTIAFPAISTGAYRFPKPKAARIAITAMRDYESSFSGIIACCFSQEDADIYRDTLAEMEGPAGG